MNVSTKRQLVLKSGRDGSGLIFTLFFVMVTGIVTGALLNAGVTHRKISQRTYNRERALHVAEAGLETVAQTIANVNGYLASAYSATGSVDGYSWKATSTKLSEFVFKVDSTGTVDGVQWCVHASRVELPSWSQFALWMDVNGGITFVAADIFNGWVHSNDRLSFTPSGGLGPQFYDKLTSAATNFSGSTNGSVFAKGFQLGADQDTMANVDFPALLTNAQLYGGTILTGLTTITISGTIAKVTNPRKGWTNFNYTIGASNLIYIKNAPSAGLNSTGDLWVAGRLDGRLTIAVENDIYITNHIIYASNPITNTSSDDALGLISKDDIVVWTNAPNNLNIYAAMLATGQANTNDPGSFGVQNHNTGSTRGDLNVWGSIVQDTRGAVGTQSGGVVVTGFEKNYGYDTRFRLTAPPYYPRVATKVDFAGWREGPI